jgi:sulfonate transport system ATP-binding protein
MTARESTGSRIELRQVDKSYGRRQVLKDLNLSITPGEFVAIVGRSGCGKSTLLRLLAGLEKPTGGAVNLDDHPVGGLRSATRVMFQEARLLPWRRVIENVALGLHPRQLSQAQDALAKVGLADRGHDWPAQLSGGQRQRVALARALVHQPKLLLLDEPLGALDALTRIEMQQLIESLWLEQGFTALLVTHDVQEAVTLADRVILIEGGTLALDEQVHLARPRQRTQLGFSTLERRILDRVLQQHDTPPPHPPYELPGLTVSGLRWAI